MKSKYKILSLDGGGSWALIQAKCLHKMYGDLSGHKILKKFDLIVANSGGSLVAAALAENMSPLQIISLFKDDEIIRSIFYKKTFFATLYRRLLGIGPKYSAKEKIIGLSKQLCKVSEKTLPQLANELNSNRTGRQTHFLITTFDYYQERATFFRSDLTSRGITEVLKGGVAKPETVTFTQAVHAASNAPVNYFDEPAFFSCTEKGPLRAFWDGAVGGYNNPVVAGITEALINGEDRENIVVLSIGTANLKLPLKLSSSTNAVSPVLVQEKKKTNFKKDALLMATSIIADPPETANFVAYSILHPKLLPERTGFVRMNPLIQPVMKNNKWDFPETISPDDFEQLRSLDMDATDEKDIKLIERFCDAWLNDYVPNQAIRTDENFEPIIGHARFSKALSAWQSINPIEEIIREVTERI